MQPPAWFRDARSRLVSRTTDSDTALVGFVGRARRIATRTQRHTTVRTALPSGAGHSDATNDGQPTRLVSRLLDVTLNPTLLLLALAAPPETTDKPEPEPLFERGPYFAMGVAPAVTLYRNGFAPALRYDAETGFAWTRRHLRLSVGADAHLLQYFGRKKPAGGVDAMLTASYRFMYVRAGLGVMAGLPATRMLDDTRPAVGGVVGIGLQTWREHVGGRIGVDYDLRVDTAGRPIQTFLLTLRIAFG